MDTQDQESVKHVLITGCTGCIGTALTERLLQTGCWVSILSRDRFRAHDEKKGVGQHV